jgi:hypothetical protein
MTDEVARRVIDRVLVHGFVNTDAEPAPILGTTIRVWIDLYIDEDYEAAGLIRVTDGAFCGDDEAFLFVSTWTEHEWVEASAPAPWIDRRNEARTRFVEWVRDHPSTASTA